MNDYFQESPHGQQQTTYEPPNNDNPTAYSGAESFQSNLNGQENDLNRQFSGLTGSVNSQDSPSKRHEDQEGQFAAFEQDEMTRRIREEEGNIQRLLREKSQKQYKEKQERKDMGRRQMQEFTSRKEGQKSERIAENRKIQVSKREAAVKLNLESGWGKVVASINPKQGEYKGTKEVGRMRQAILHKRGDQAGK